MTIQELKSQAYDCLAQIELYQNRLMQLNKMISNYVPENIGDKKDNSGEGVNKTGKSKK